MATTLKNAQQRATMAAKEERARDAALAMQEYEAEKLAIGIKTARLRALRLAKEAESNERTKRKNPGTIPPVCTENPIRIDCVTESPKRQRR